MLTQLNSCCWEILAFSKANGMALIFPGSHDLGVIMHIMVPDLTTANPYDKISNKQGRQSIEFGYHQEMIILA